MDKTTAILVYLTIFRVSIIAAGITSIVLGYRLFARGVFPGNQVSASKDGEDVTAEIAGARFTLRNAAPGTCFALFGAIIMISMIITGGPEVTLKSLDDGMEATFRGDENESISSHSKRALSYLDQGENDKALATVNGSLKSLAGPMNDFAWVLFKTDDDASNAVLLSEIAVSVNPHEVNFLDTLAEIQYKNGEKQKALETLMKANDIEPIFDDKVKEWSSSVR